MPSGSLIGWPWTVASAKDRSAVLACLIGMCIDGNFDESEQVNARRTGKHQW